MSTHGIHDLKRHKEYYLRDGNVCFVVEDTLFRLHRYFFERDSEYFYAKLNHSRGEDGSPDCPHRIHDVKPDEFAQFVWVWYNPLYSFSKQDKEKWLTILRLATDWRFEGIRKLAIRHLEKLELEPIEKITTYKQYAVDNELLLPSYVLLCRRERLPSPDEGRKLTLDTVLKIASAREQGILSAVERGCKTPTTTSVPEDIFEGLVAHLFELTPHSNDQTVRVEGQTVNNGNALRSNLVDPEVVTVKEPSRRRR